MIKGHTKIELTNVKTGQKKVIEDTNMVTNGMGNFMMSNPFNPISFVPTNRPFNEHTPKSYELCGGLLLFENQIEENPDMIFPPAGNKMIGNAVAGVSSGSAVPEMGYFDAPNSTFEYSGDTTTQKFVFDFGTSQGNGQISSVCLASMLAGYVGFGNHSGERVAEKQGNLNFVNSLFTDSYLGHGYQLYDLYPMYYNEGWVGAIPFMFDYHKNCVYTMNYYAQFYNSTYPAEHMSSGTLKLQKYHVPLSSYNPLQFVFSGTTIEPSYQEFTVEIPAEMIASASTWKSQYNQIFHSYDGTYIIASGVSSKNWSANSTLFVLHVNSDLETKLYTVKNTTGKTIRNCYGSSADTSYDYMAIKNGYLFCQTSESSPEVFKINLEDSTDVVSLGTVTPTNTQFSLLSDRLFIGGRHIIEDVENVILPVNSQFGRSRNHHFAICGCKFMYFSMYYIGASKKSSSTDGRYGNLMFNPMYLATINNLSEPVVKTADLTMKITYTLTCTEEGGEAGDVT